MKNITPSAQERLVRSGLTVAGDWVFFEQGGAALAVGYDGEFSALLASVHGKNPARAFFYAKPAEPYWSAMNILADGVQVIQPDDSETKLLLGTLPVLKPSSTLAIANALQDSRAIVIHNAGVIVSACNLAQASVIFSAVCFAIIVKFLVDIAKAQTGAKLVTNGKAAQILASLMEIAERHRRTPRLMRGIFNNAPQAKMAINQAGKQTVALGLVNASFGNISYVLGDDLLISTTGSFLDDLKNAIVTVPMKQKSRFDRIASSELPAHRKILAQGTARSLLHGHPVFVVAMSLIRGLANGAPAKSAYRAKGDCDQRICGTPVVVGETGGGRYGLAKVLPQALAHDSIAIASGHGVFCTGKTDFREPLKNMLILENDCRQAYLRQITGVL